MAWQHCNEHFILPYEHMKKLAVLKMAVCCCSQYCSKWAWSPSSGTSVCLCSRIGLLLLGRYHHIMANNGCLCMGADFLVSSSCKHNHAKFGKLSQVGTSLVACHVGCCHCVGLQEGKGNVAGNLESTVDLYSQRNTCSNSSRKNPLTTYYCSQPVCRL